MTKTCNLLQSRLTGTPNQSTRAVAKRPGRSSPRGSTRADIRLRQPDSGSDRADDCTYEPTGDGRSTWSDSRLNVKWAGANWTRNVVFADLTLTGQEGRFREVGVTVDYAGNSQRTGFMRWVIVIWDPFGYSLSRRLMIRRR